MSYFIMKVFRGVNYSIAGQGRNVQKTNSCNYNHYQTSRLSQLLIIADRAECVQEIDCDSLQRLPYIPWYICDWVDSARLLYCVNIYFLVINSPKNLLKILRCNIWLWYVVSLVLRSIYLPPLKVLQCGGFPNIITFFPLSLYLKYEDETCINLYKPIVF